MKRVTLLAALALFAWAGGAAAQEGDIVKGQDYADHVCAGCHAVLANEEFSPLTAAPTFQEVADTPGMTEMALTVWLQSSHPTMPNVVLTQDEMRNVVAYIRSLKKD